MTAMASASNLEFPVPDDLTELDQWVLWRYQDRDGKRTKVPHTCLGYRASTTKPGHWSKFELALEMAARPRFADGIGFVFTSDDPFCGIDLDHVWQSDADEGAAWARGVLGRFADTYLEGSPSDCGIKIWCRAKPTRCGRWLVDGGAIEVYDHGRFFAVTGRSNGARIVADHQADIEALIGNLDQNRPGTQAHSRGCRPNAIPEIIPQGQRHNTLVSLAGTLWKRGVDPEAVEAALLAVNRRQCDPPHGPEHIHKIVASMANWRR